MKKKEVWVEGTFAGEMKIDDPLVGPCAEARVKDDFESDEDDIWDEQWYEQDDGDDEPSSDKGRCGSHNKDLGRRGEKAAARYLERMGYEILERNYICPFGEADIIAKDGDVVVFVEVKTRSGISKGFPSEAVDRRKRDKYEKIAAWFLSDYGEVDFSVRFDVVGLLVISDDRAFLRHYSNAFGSGM